MFKDFLYNLWIFNRGNNIYLAPTLLTLLYFYAERRPVKTRFRRCAHVIE